MTFPQSVRSVLSSYATFSGRARRSEYWWFYLFTVLVTVAAAVVDGVLGMSFSNDVGIVGLIASLALLLPSLAVTARRLHDTGRTGWWMLLPLIPMVATVGLVVVVVVLTVSAAFSAEVSGAAAVAAVVLLVLSALATLAASIVVLVFLCQDSHPGTNKHGSSPKQQPAFPAGPAGWPTESGYGSPYGYQPPGPYPPQQ
jgi:uncharacterized membrane protein YhaH (DUF805 family)